MELDLPSKNSVRRAGKAVVEAGFLENTPFDAIEVIDKWRKAHLQPLVATSMWLRKPATERGGNAPAQRLKRRDTVLDKLISGRAKDASTMHDLGGCRIIFPDIKSIESFRKYLEHETRARHVLLHDRDKYDYISNPKVTGYRGVHYIYGYNPSSNKNIALRGLKTEIQLRTGVQHAWATAVEIADLVSDTRIKFEQGQGDYGMFFKLASELLARHHEDRNSCYPEKSSDDLKNEFAQIEKRIQLLDRLSKLKEQGDIDRIKKHTVLAFMEDDTVDIFGYTKQADAVAKELELLSDERCSNVVYVSSASQASIRSSYRNYLTNPEDFVELLHEAMS